MEMFARENTSAQIFAYNFTTVILTQALNVGVSLNVTLNVYLQNLELR